MSNITKDMLNDEQRFILDDLIPKVNKLVLNDGYKTAKIEDRMFCLTASAGCGKTFLTTVLLKELDTLGINVRVTSTTHKSLAILDEMLANAGVNVESSTIHSYLKLKLKECHITGTHILEQDGAKAVEEVSVLIVEESSMCSGELFEYIEAEMLRDTICVAILISDRYQLPPVQATEFPLYTREDITKYELTKVVRQAEGSNILKFATYIRDAIISKNYPTNIEIKEFAQECIGDDFTILNSDKELLSEYYNSKYEPESNLIVGYKNATVSRYNKKIRNTLIEDDCCLTIGEKLVFNEAHFDTQDNCVHKNNETIEIQSFKKLEDKELGVNYYKIIDTEDRLFRAVDFNDLMDFEYELSELSKKAKKSSGLEKSILWKRFFELKKCFQSVSYIYAFSSHKTQGSTCNEAYVLLGEILNMRSIIGEDNMLRSLYVSVTRPRHRLILLMR